MVYTTNCDAKVNIFFYFFGSLGTDAPEGAASVLVFFPPEGADSVFAFFPPEGVVPPVFPFPFLLFRLAPRLSSTSSPSICQRGG